MAIVGLGKTVLKISAAHGAVFVVEGNETERLPTASGASLIVILHVSSLYPV
jgi:hypothetical protein